MEQHNLDFDIEMTRDQWEQLGRRAAALGPADGGFDWRASEPEQIRVFLRDDDAPTFWRDFVATGSTYGAHERELAHFEFNGGRPFARVPADDQLVTQPVFTEAEEDAMARQLNDWVRRKWHELLKTSGLHYDRGHIPEDGG